MKRVQYDRYGGPETMYIGEHAPSEPGPHQVRINVKAAAVNPLDWQLRRGVMRLFMRASFPRGMGSDFAGIVDAVGPGVTNVRMGDEVFGSADFARPGAFGESIVVGASQVAQKPRRLSFDEAACLPIPAATAWAAIVEKAKASEGTRIFINGCSGAVGAAAVQLGIARGARVSGASGNGSRGSAEAAGVDPVYSYQDVDSFAESGLFDAVFDTVGNLSVSAGVSMLKPNGVFIDINPTPGRLVAGLVSRRYALTFATAGLKHLSDIAELAEEGVLRSTVGVVVPFERSLDAIAKAELGPRTPGKVVVTF